MNAIAHKRTSQRFQSEARVMLEDFRTGFYYKGTLYNYSMPMGDTLSQDTPPGREEKYTSR
jgi:hypothetical protein